MCESERELFFVCVSAFQFCLNIYVYDMIASMRSSAAAAENQPGVDSERDRDERAVGYQ